LHRLGFLVEVEVARADDESAGVVRLAVDARLGLVRTKGRERGLIVDRPGGAAQLKTRRNDRGIRLVATPCASLVVERSGRSRDLLQILHTSDGRSLVVTFVATFLIAFRVFLTPFFFRTRCQFCF